MVLAVAVCLALWIGSRQVQTGDISPGELFLFIAYALTVRLVAADTAACLIRVRQEVADEYIED